MNTPILNRKFQHPADGWYHIEPLGEHLNAEAGLTQVIDQEAGESIVNRFNAAAEAGTLSHGHEMLIDHEHFKHDLDKESRAYGWLTALQNRADGIQDHFERLLYMRRQDAAAGGQDAHAPLLIATSLDFVLE